MRQHFKAINLITFRLIRNKHIKQKHKMFLNYILCFVIAFGFALKLLSESVKFNSFSIQFEKLA